MSNVNIFKKYEQEENHITNGLMSILRMSTFDNPRFFALFLRGELGLDLSERVNTFNVLGIHGTTADGELCGKDFCIQFETKIVSERLRRDQIRAHLKHLQHRRERLKRLILLTPDDRNSRYIKEFRSLDETRILHLEWNRVYEFLKNSVRKRPRSVFSKLISQYLEHIQEMVFKQNFAGIILKIRFGEDSGVDPKTYLTELENDGRWHTPSKYKKLDGAGRKLMLYDGVRKGITAEVEIKKLKRIKGARVYPWDNIFAPRTLRRFPKPIRLSRIRSMAGFKGFGKHRQDRAPCRNITREQYRELTGQ